MIRFAAANGKWPRLLALPVAASLLLLAACKTEQSPPAPSSSSSSSSSPASSSASGSTGSEASPGSPGSGSMPPAPSPGSGPDTAGTTTPTAGGGMPGSGSTAPTGGATAGSDGAIAAGNEGMPGGIPGTGSPGDSGADTGTPGAGSGSAAPGVTTDEAVGQIDAQLDASLAVFDGMILTERRAAQTIGAGGNGGSAGPEAEGDDVADATGGAGGPLFEEADLAEPGIHSEEATVPEMPSGESAGNTIAGGPGSGHGNVPADLVDGSDDDIVARQIREAAMNETDPVLREKLWDEYRKYKKGQ